MMFLAFHFYFTHELFRHCHSLMPILIPPPVSHKMQRADMIWSQVRWQLQKEVV